MVLKKVVPGGQAGVERAGLDASLNAGIPICGYCPKDWRAADGVIPE